MAIKIIQTVPKISASPTSASASIPITLKSGYIRVSTAVTSAHISIGTNPTSTEQDFHLPPHRSEVIKERIARQKIAGISTGTSTTIHFDNNAGNPFLMVDYVSIEDITSPVGINTTHNSILSMTDSSITINFDSSSFENIEVGSGNVARSVKVSALGSGGSSDVFITEVVQLVTE
jgi:hypothetical protein